MRRKISTGLTLIVVLLALLLTGCGGFNGGYSVSPASFLIPGLMQNQIPLEPTRDVNAPESPTPPTSPADSDANRLAG